MTCCIWATVPFFKNLIITIVLKSNTPKRDIFPDYQTASRRGFAVFVFFFLIKLVNRVGYISSVIAEGYHWYLRDYTEYSLAQYLNN